MPRQPLLLRPGVGLNLRRRQDWAALALVWRRQGAALRRHWNGRQLGARLSFLRSNLLMFQILFGHGR
jgi:hypothetical protein